MYVDDIDNKKKKKIRCFSLCEKDVLQVVEHLYIDKLYAYTSVHVHNALSNTFDF